MPDREMGHRACAQWPIPRRKYRRKEMGGMPDEYYELRGWNKDGVPTREKLIELGLNDVADQLHLK
ncbi:MAG: hypothetical protein NT096_04185 [Proteobacteria bacterium]|nr:hypothetical protein [Pseudomonadota bacterium]